MLFMYLHHLFIAIYVIHFVLQVLWDYEIMRGTDKCAFEKGRVFAVVYMSVCLCVSVCSLLSNSLSRWECSGVRSGGSGDPKGRFVLITFCSFR